MGQKHEFLEETITALGDKTAKLAESSEITVQRNSLRRHDP
jgi:hypothetical protein